ncbi:MAG: hypothetical protein V7K98_10245 [Nostoc sp.]
MGHGAWRDEVSCSKLFPNIQCPMPNAQCPIPYFTSCCKVFNASST